MKRSFFALCAALVLTNNSPQQVAAAESNSAEDAIRRTAQQFVEAYDQGKAQDVAALWTPDGEYAIGRETLKGRKAIANLYETFFKAHPGSKMKVNIESVRMVAPTVALEQGTASTTDGPTKTRSESAYTAVHVKQDGKWLMASVRESEIASQGNAADLGEIGWLIGSWEGEGAAKAQVDYAWMPNKHFIKGEFTSTAKDAKVPGGTQIIGRDPLSGRIISWFFNADGGQAFGQWRQQGSSWIIKTKGVTPEGARTAAVNVLYHPDDNVVSWKSVNRSIDQTRLPDTKELVMERNIP
jgi:uncharacterized protein (TIGR02246 family)